MRLIHPINCRSHSSAMGLFTTGLFHGLFMAVVLTFMVSFCEIMQVGK